MCNRLDLAKAVNVQMDKDEKATFAFWIGDERREVTLEGDALMLFLLERKNTAFWRSHNQGRGVNMDCKHTNKASRSLWGNDWEVVCENCGAVLSTFTRAELPHVS